MACSDSGRISSASATAPTTTPSRITCSTVDPCAAQSRVSGSASSPRPASIFGPPTPTSAPDGAGDAHAVVRAERVGDGHREAAVVGGLHDRPASGCSLSRSTEAARATDLVLAPRRHAAGDEGGLPLVRVPVLSKSTASTVRIRSSARRSVISTPARAARSVAMDTTSGMARPSACGQAMTRTVTVRSTAWSGSPRISQTAAVMIAAPRAK